MNGTETSSNSLYLKTPQTSSLTSPMQNPGMHCRKIIDRNRGINQMAPRTAATLPAKANRPLRRTTTITAVIVATQNGNAARRSDAPRRYKRDAGPRPPQPHRRPSRRLNVVPGFDNMEHKVSTFVGQ